MRKTIFILLAIFFIGSIEAQKKATPLIVTGTVYDGYGPAKLKKVYYALVGDHFSAKQFITTDSNSRYTFDLSKTKYSKVTEGEIRFIIDLADSTGECFSSLGVTPIVSPPAYFAKQKMIPNDLDIYWNCSATVYYEPERDEEKKFLGVYNMSVNDTLSTLTVDKGLMDFKELKRYPGNIQREFRGAWGVNQAGDTLVLYYQRVTDLQTGTMLLKYYPRKFAVVMKGGVFFLKENEFEFPRQ